MGAHYWPYGIDENRRELDALMRYAEADGSIEAPVVGPREALRPATTFDHFNF